MIHFELFLSRQWYAGVICPPPPPQYHFLDKAAVKKFKGAFIEKSLSTLKLLYKFETSSALTLLDGLSKASFFANLGTSNFRSIFMNLLQT